jgi:hypothetical protein
MKPGRRGRGGVSLGGLLSALVMLLALCWCVLCTSGVEDGSGSGNPGVGDDSNSDLIAIVSNSELDSDDIARAEYYSVVVDAGSTGSRAFIFHKRFHAVKNEFVILGVKGLKVTPGLSSFSDRMHEIEDYLIPLFVNAQTHIPVAFHDNTTVHVLGTAGMRLLDHDIQENIWFLIRHLIPNNPQFSLNKQSFVAHTLDGTSEAYFGVLSANYVTESINAELVPSRKVPLVGSLDMGGSSTQLIFHLHADVAVDSESDNVNGDSNETERTVAEENAVVADILEGDDGIILLTKESFWSHSWINYGVQIAREAIWSNVEVIVRS